MIAKSGIISQLSGMFFKKSHKRADDHDITFWTPGVLQEKLSQNSKKFKIPLEKSERMYYNNNDH
ncbi:MAG: hypothetical protein IJ806_04975 [Ruminococcus sp.]|nr:hypothetical protein [Ruminococcus sp.]